MRSPDRVVIPLTSVPSEASCSNCKHWQRWNSEDHGVCSLAAHPYANFWIDNGGEDAVLVTGESFLCADWEEDDRDEG